MNNSNTDFYNVEALSNELGVTAATVRDYLRKGKIKGYKKLGRWYIFQSDLVEFIKS